ncbi:hypothetical protein GCM10027454_10510 [Algoriphagus aestuariicola]|jgi:hypothetical protein
MESGFFHVVIVDVEGRVLMHNRDFAKVDGLPGQTQFADILTPNSAAEFNYSLELLLCSPKTKRDLMLEHSVGGGGKASRVWWEFSVITNPEMDLSGILGIGVGMQFLEQEMPWDNLVDVLGFGKIALDKDFRILNWDDRILQWFDADGENWKGNKLMEAPAFKGLAQLNEMLGQVSNEKNPKCLMVESHTSPVPAFAALLTASTEGYHLFLVPKEIQSQKQTEKPAIPTNVLACLPGAVFVLNKAGKLSQINQEGKNLGRIWKGRAYSEGFSLTFPCQPNRFSKLLRAIDSANNGLATDLELKMLMPDQEFQFWDAYVRPIQGGSDSPEGVLIQVFDSSKIKKQIFQVNRENDRLRDLALSPSHILRGPLSSMIGLLELIDSKQLDRENQKLFNYLKPLSKELDQVIRDHAKKMSTFT